MKIDEIKALAGQDVWVFDKGKDKYVKRLVHCPAGQNPYVESDARGFYRMRDKVWLTEASDVVTEADLPAAKKRLAARRKAERQAEAERVARFERALNVADRLLLAGIGERFSDKRIERAPVDWNGRIKVTLTPEQAETLLAALTGHTTNPTDKN